MSVEIVGPPPTKTGGGDNERRRSQVDPRRPRPQQPPPPLGGVEVASMSPATKKALGLLEPAGGGTAVIDQPRTRTTEITDLTTVTDDQVPDLGIRLPEYSTAELRAAGVIILEREKSDTRRGGRIRRPLTPGRVISRTIALGLGIGLTYYAAKSAMDLRPDTIPTDLLGLQYDGTPVDATTGGQFRGYLDTLRHYYDIHAPGMDFGLNTPTGEITGFGQTVIELHQAINDTLQGKEAAGVSPYGFGYVDPDYLTMLRTAYENPDQYPQIAQLLEPFSHPDHFPQDQLVAAQDEAGQQILSLIMEIGEHRNEAYIDPSGTDGTIYLNLPDADGQLHQWAIPPLPNHA